MVDDVPQIPARRTTLVVPGDAPDRVAAAGDAGADQVVVDLADLDPTRKDIARAGVAEALAADTFGHALVAVRVNAIDTMWAYRDIVDVVERAGEFVDGIVVPRVVSGDDLTFVDTLLAMIEQRIDLSHHIDIEAEIATPQALTLLDEITLASDRLEALVLDEAGALAALGLPDPASDDVTGLRQTLRTRVLIAARSLGLAAIIAPAGDPDDIAAYHLTIEHARALGYDGARCAHASQMRAANAVFGAR